MIQALPLLLQLKDISFQKWFLCLSWWYKAAVQSEVWCKRRGKQWGEHWMYWYWYLDQRVSIVLSRQNLLCFMGKPQHIWLHADYWLSAKAIWKTTESISFFNSLNVPVISSLLLVVFCIWKKKNGKKSCDVSLEMHSLFLQSSYFMFPASEELPPKKHSCLMTMCKFVNWKQISSTNIHKSNEGILEGRASKDLHQGILSLYFDTVFERYASEICIILEVTT